MKKQSQAVFKLLRASMEARGWMLQEPFGLPAFFGKNSVVTPFFHCSDIPKRPFGKQIIEGVIGVLHRGFEEMWVADTVRRPGTNGFAAALHLANFSELGDRVYVPCEGAFVDEVDALSKELAGILERMPATEEQLASSFESGRLGGLAVSRFSGYSFRAKFKAFEDFVAQVAAAR